MTAIPLEKGPASEGYSSGGIHVEGVSGDVSFRLLGDFVSGNKFVTNTTTIQISVEAVTQRPLVTASPYRGLDPFQDIHQSLFFGRDQLVKQLLAQLSASNLLLVLGASGSGKSSVVRAGLLPTITGLMGSRFRYFTLVPDADPFESLRSSFQNAGFTQSQTRDLADPQSGLQSRLLHSLQREGEQWVIFVDQFEEVFTTSEVGLRESFVAALLQLAQEPAGSIKLVLAMRADFLDRLGPFPDFARLVEKNINLVTDMHADQLRLAIEQPAGRHGVVFNPGLVEEIIKDVQGQAGPLPLLQYALDLLWEEERRRNRLVERHLKAETYRELGGVRGALQRRADEIYSSFGDAAGPKNPSAKQETVRQILLRMVDIAGEGSGDAVWRPVRRRVAKAIFRTNEESELLRALIDAKLIVSDREGTEATVEVAHESLFSSWDRYKQWIEGGKQVIFTRNRLADDAGRWQRRQQQDPTGAEEELLVGSRLGQALEMQARGDFVTIIGALTKAEMQFLDASATRRNRRAQEERERQERESKKEKQLRETEAAHAAEARQRAEEQRQAKWVLAFVAVVAMGVAAVAFHFFRRAESNTRIAEAQRLAALAGTVRQKFPQRSLLLAVESVQTTSRLNEPVVQAAEEALFDSLSSMRGRALTNFSSGIAGIALSGDGWLAAATTNGIVQLRNLLDTNEAQRNIELPELLGRRLFHIAFSADGQTLAVGSAEGVALWHAPWSSNMPTSAFLRGLTAKNYSLAISADGRRVFTGVPRGPAQLWTAETNSSWPSPVDLFESSGNLVHATFSPDGHWLATSDGHVVLWNLDHVDSLQSQELAHYRFDTCLAFSEDSRWLVSLGHGETNKMQLWRFGEDGRLKGTSTVNEPEDNLGYCAAFSEDGKWLATGHFDGKIKLWPLQLPLDQQPSRILVGHQGTVSSIVFLDTTPYLASGGDDRSIRLWEPLASDSLQVIDLAEWRGQEGAVGGLLFARRAYFLVSGGRNEQPRLWELNSSGPLAVPKRVIACDTELLKVNFNSTHDLLWTAGDDNVNRLWDLRSTDWWKSPLVATNDVGEYQREYSPDGSWLILAYTNALVRLCRQDVTNGAIPQFSLTNALMCFSPEGRWLGVRTWDNATARGNLQIYDLSGKAQPTLAFSNALHSLNYREPVFSSDGRHLALSGPPQLFAFDGERGWSFRGDMPEPDLFYLGFTADNQWLIAGDRNGELRLRKLNQDGGLDHSRLIRKAIDRYLSEVETSSDGKWLVALTSARTGYIFDLSRSDEKNTAILGQDESGIIHAGFSPDGHRLLTVGYDNILRLWNLDSGIATRIVETSVRLPLSPPKSGFLYAGFTGNGRYLVAAEDRGRLAIWPTDIGELLRIAPEVCGRNLSLSEWKQTFPSRPYVPTFSGLPSPPNR